MGQRTIGKPRVAQPQHADAVSHPVAGGPTTAGAIPAREPRGWITGLSLLICLLALIATTAGIFTFGGAHRAVVSPRGEAYSLQGGGLYAFDSVSGAAQEVGQDWVTLIVGIPLLLLATYLAWNGSLRGRLLRAGALWYFAYTYLIMSFGSAYNPLFLVYVMLFSASTFAFVLSMLSIDAAELPARLSSGFHRRTVAGVLIGLGSLLGLMWLGRIVPSLLGGPAPALEAYHTLFVQAADLAIAVPLLVLSGVLLIQRRPAGYLLSAVMVVKGATFGLALVAMVAGMAWAGVPVSIPEVAFSATAATLGAATMLNYVLNVSGSAEQEGSE